MDFISLASSSSGNAYIVDDGQTRLLLECGVPWRKLQTLSGHTVTRAAACLITHEHGDHARSWRQVARAGIPVYASAGTVAALCPPEDPDSAPAPQMPPRLAAAGEAFTIGSFDILPFPVFHDAREPLGYLIRSRADGERLAFAADTVNLNYRFPALTLLAVECNYIAPLLDGAERLPEKVKDRIRRTHMELGTLVRWLKRLDLSTLRAVYLTHLSDACARDAEIEAAVSLACPPGVRVEVCPKERRTGGKRA